MEGGRDGRDGRLEGGREGWEDGGRESGHNVMCWQLWSGCTCLHGMEWVDNKEPYFICVRVCRYACKDAGAVCAYIIRVTWGMTMTAPPREKGILDMMGSR